MKAITKGKVEVVEKLLKRPGIQLGLKDHHGKTELVHAVERNSLELARMIVEAGAKLGQNIDMNNYDKRGRTAIIHASIN